jgi:HK97 gp10 family phage protein
MGWKVNRQAIRNVRTGLGDALDDSAEVLKEKVIRNAPKDTGKLRRSIEIKETDDLEVSVGADVEYASIVEFGSVKQSPNPYFRTAIKESKKGMLRKFRNII